MHTWHIFFSIVCSCSLHYSPTNTIQYFIYHETLYVFTYIQNGLQLCKPFWYIYLKNLSSSSTFYMLSSYYILSYFYFVLCMSFLGFLCIICYIIFFPITYSHSSVNSILPWVLIELHVKFLVIVGYSEQIKLVLYLKMGMIYLITASQKSPKHLSCTLPQLHKLIIKWDHHHP